MTRDRDAVTALAQRRFGWSRPVIGTASELVDHYGKLAERGVERVYTWFCDFAPPDTLAEFGEDVAQSQRRRVVTAERREWTIVQRAGRCATVIRAHELVVVPPAREPVRPSAAMMIASRTCRRVAVDRDRDVGQPCRVSRLRARRP